MTLSGVMVLHPKRQMGPRTRLRHRSNLLSPGVDEQRRSPNNELRTLRNRSDPLVSQPTVRIKRQTTQSPAESTTVGQKHQGSGH